MFAAFALKPQAMTADAMFAQAKATAKAEHKNVLLVFSASWCGPCKHYEQFLQDPAMKAITEKAFLVLRIDVGERPNDPNHMDTPGGVALRTALGAKEDAGYPFLMMTNENGAPIVSSYRNGDPDNDIGYPAVPTEFDWYIEMLKRAAPSLSPADLAATRNWLQQHAPH
jgi:thiol-disulfide isomerase/thioredoxin